MDVQFRFFKGDITQGELKAISDAWYKSRGDRDEALKPIFDAMPFYDGWQGGETSIWGIVCKEDNPALEQIKTEKGYKVSYFKDRNYVVKPDCRYKAGKAFKQTLEKIASILNQSPDFSDFALKKMGMYKMVGGATRVYISVCGVVDDVFIAKVPVKDKGNFGDEISSIPDYLTEIKESEFLAIQGL